MSGFGALVAASFAVAVVALLVAGVRAGRWGSARHRERLRRLSDVDLVELFVFVDPRLFIRWNLAALLVLPVSLGALAGSAWVAASTAILVLLLPALLYRRLRRQRLRRFQRQLPDAMTAVSAGLRGGLSLVQALDLVSRHQPRPVSQEFALVLRQQRLGLPLDEALQALAFRTGLHDVRMLVATLGIARDLGGGLAEVLERLADSVRRRVAMEDRIEALTAQGRMQGAIVGALPLLVALALYLMEPQAMSRLFTTQVGWLVVVVVGLLELAGWALIRKVVRIDV